MPGALLMVCLRGVVFTSCYGPEDFVGFTLKPYYVFTCRVEGDLDVMVKK